MLTDLPAGNNFAVSLGGRRIPARRVRSEASMTQPGQFPSSQHACMVCKPGKNWFGPPSDFLCSGRRGGSRLLYVTFQHGAEEAHQGLRSATLCLKAEDLLADVEVLRPWTSAPSLEEAVDQVVAVLGGMPGGAYVCLDMSWVPREGAAETILAFETALMARAVPGLSLLCMYNSEVLPPEALRTAVLLHPTVVYRGIWCRNPYNLKPLEMTSQKRSEIELERILDGLLDLEQTIARLEESEVRYRTLLEAAPDGTMLLRGREVVFANRAALALMGANQLAQLQGLDLTTLVPGLDPEAWTNMPHGRIPELRLQRVDGSSLFAEISAGSVQIGGESLYQIVLRDLSETRTMTRQLRLHNRVLDVLNSPLSHSGAIHEILGLIAEFGDFLAVGIRLAESGGYPYFDSIGMDAGHSELAGQDDSFSGEPCVCRRVLEGRPPQKGGHRSPGGSFWTSSVARAAELCGIVMRSRCTNPAFKSVAFIPLRSEGEIVGLLHLCAGTPEAFNDETIELLESLGASIGVAVARARRQDALLQSRKELAIHNRVADIFLTGQEDTVLGDILQYLTEAASASIGAIGRVDHLGVAAIHVRAEGGHFNLSLDPQGWESCPARSELVDSLGATSVAEFNLGQGAPVIKDALVVPIRSKGAVLGFLAVGPSRNLGRSELSDLLVRICDKMAPVLAARTTEEAFRQEKASLENKLIQTQKMEAIGTLAGGIAHDFNNLLSAVLGYGELARMDLPDDSPAHQSLDQIIGAAKRARDLTGQILAFSRQTQTERRVLRPQSIVKETVKLLRGSIPSSIEIRTHVNQDCSMVNADPGQLHQIVMNLCTNAYQAMLDDMNREAHGRRASVLDIGLDDVVLEGSKAGRLGLAEGRFVLLSVSDSGPGIEESIRDKVFDPYFTTKPKGKGTGLGLAIVHSVAASHGGAVELDSQLGEGSCFKVYLPAMAAADTQESTASADNSHLQGRERILLAEDEAAVVDGITRYLTRLGYSVSAFRSPTAALEEFQKAPEAFDILLSDYHMPRMTGVELIGLVRRLRPNLPTIMFSGFTDNLSKNAARMAGVDEYLAKPFSMKDLAATIRALLDPAPGA